MTLDQRWSVHDKVTEAWGSERQRIKEHHVFLRLPGDESFLYAGKAHLGSYSAAEANFTLNEKLPRDEWLRLGGYPGWLSMSATAPSGSTPAIWTHFNASWPRLPARSSRIFA